MSLAHANFIRKALELLLLFCTEARNELQRMHQQHRNQLSGEHRQQRYQAVDVRFKAVPTRPCLLSPH
jgi:hypothetical protein